MTDRVIKIIKIIKRHDVFRTKIQLNTIAKLFQTVKSALTYNGNAHKTKLSKRLS